MLAVRNCCYVAVCSAALGASAPTGGGEGRGISWRPPAYSFLSLQTGNIRGYKCKSKIHGVEERLTRPNFGEARESVPQWMVPPPI